MRTIRLLAVLLAILALAACQTRAPPPPAAAPFAGDEGAIVLDGVAFPRMVAGLTRSGQIDYEKQQPGLGTSFAYRSDRAVADVYLYDRKNPSVPDDPQSPLIRRELAIAIEEIDEMVRAGRYASASARRVYMGGSTNDRAEFLAAQLVILQGSDPFDSYVFVGSCRGKFLKIRYSTPADLASAEEAGRFAKAMFAQRGRPPS
jgi:hypothetical protein